MNKWLRLRHLHCIRCRNMIGICYDSFNQEIFFALSASDNLGYYYRSEKSSNVINSDWEDIDLSFEKVKSFSFKNQFVITFFLCKNNRNKIIYEANIHISGLIKFDINNLSQNLESLLILFQFNNTWFGIPMDSFNYTQNIIDSDRNLIFSNDIPGKFRLHKSLYDNDTINKFLHLISINNLKQIHDQYIHRNRVELNILIIKSKICQMKYKVNKINNMKLQFNLLQSEKTCKDQILNDLMKKYDYLNQKINRVIKLTENVEIDSVRNVTIIRRLSESYDHISQSYMIRMYQLIKELARIFPIEPTEATSSTQNSLSQSHSTNNLSALTNASSSNSTLVSNYSSNDLGANNNNVVIAIRSNDKLSICGLHLPNSDRQILFNQDAITLSALGMVYRLLIALSQIYDIPLRYPLISDASKMIIRDNIIEIDENERNFLIAKNTSASFKLQYAIYLINLNITAIRGYFSLFTKHPDRTLWNINTLIEGKNKNLTQANSLSNPSSPKYFRNNINMNLTETGTLSEPQTPSKHNTYNQSSSQNIQNQQNSTSISPLIKP